MRADIHDGPEHNALQSKAGYIDARPHQPSRRKLLHRTAGPYIRVIFDRFSRFVSRVDVRSVPKSDLPGRAQAESALALSGRSGESLAPSHRDGKSRAEGCREKLTTWTLLSNLFVRAAQRSAAIHVWIFSVQQSGVVHFLRRRLLVFLGEDLREAAVF
jgi:hypothetical protein